MRIFPAFYISLFFLCSCARPVAKFSHQESNTLVAPVEVSFQNTSTGADSYTWVIDDTLRYDTVDISHLFLESGRHTIKLISKKGQKQSIASKELIINPPTNCLVHLETNYGNMLLELSELTPKHRDSFARLVDAGYYDGIIFHRVIDGFMIQAGDNKLRKNKYPNPTPKKETMPEFREELIHHKGALSAARMPDDVNPEKASSATQFYIVHGKELSDKSIDNYESSRPIDYTQDQRSMYKSVGGAPQLDGEYTIFGKLISGFDTLDKIAQIDTDNRDKPLEDVIIIKAKNIN